MRRTALTPRPDWRAQAEEAGFEFHTFGGEPYWDESACYRFSLEQIERDIEGPTGELTDLCYEAVEFILGNEELLHRFGIPETHWSYLRQSWERRDKDLYGRFDFHYDGKGPAKLYEFNGDTPTGLYEASVFQWLWLEDLIRLGTLPASTDQFNSIQEHLVDGFGALDLAGPTLHFTCVRDNSEDRGTTAYLEDCARQGGLATKFLFIDEIGVDAAGRFNDLGDQPITNLFKLYPWEWLLREDFARHLPTSGTTFYEPAWKAVLSNKALLPVLWHMFKGHPNLLPAYFEDDPEADSLGAEYVRKPLLGREGANIQLVTVGGTRVAPGPYGEEGFIRQAFAPLPGFDGHYPVLGSWVVMGEACGLGVREENNPITSNAARFVPHVIEP